MRDKIFTAKQIENRFSIIRISIAILISLACAFVLIATVSETPLKDFITLIIGPISSSSRMITVVTKMIPLIFTGIAMSLVHSAGQINISAEGAFFASCVAATSVAVIPGIPMPIHIILCMLAGALAGMIVMGIPGILYVKFDAVTIVSALMINYIALYIGLYVILNPLRDPSAGFEASFVFSDSAIIPKFFGNGRVHMGIVIAILVVIFSILLLYKSRLGYASRTVGKNKAFAKLSGINVNKTIVSISLIAGAIAGLGGTVEILGNYNRFIYTGFTNHGWDGIMVAVLCRNNPKYVPLGALFFAYLKTSADSLNMTSSIPPEIISVIQAIIIIFVAAERFLLKLEHNTIVLNVQKKLENEELEMKGKAL